MCGILVVFSKTGRLDPERCERALDRLGSRGPDFRFSQILYDHRLFLGQTVLSIVGDPGIRLDAYHRSFSGRFDILLNGEIYNHENLFGNQLKPRGIKIPSGTDTETLVNLHELEPPSAVYRDLRGMFAYAVYDNERRSLLIGRDLIGEKVLYTYEDRETLVISSEIGPILEAVPSIKVDRDVLREYFFTRHLLTPERTSFQGVKVFPPGTLAEYKLSSSSFETLYHRSLADLIDPVEIVKNKAKSVDEIADELTTVFQTNANALTPRGIGYCGVFSGGIDSSLGTSFMAEIRPPAHVIALQFPGKDRISEQLQPFEPILGQSIETVPVSVDTFAGVIDEAYLAACGPLPTHSFISQAILSRCVQKQGLKIVVGGHGGDELFGGYESYRSLNTFGQFPESNPSIYSGVVPLGFEFAGWEPEELAAENDARWTKFGEYFAWESDPAERVLQTVLYSDSTIELESVGVREADTMSMLFSVEPRSFYLGWDVLRFVLNLPAVHKIHLAALDPDQVTRPAMKEIFARRFSRELLLPKQGFSGFPNEVGEALLGGEYDLVGQVLGLTNIPRASGDAQRAIEWKLMNMELFLQRFRGFL